MPLIIFLISISSVCIREKTDLKFFALIFLILGWSWNILIAVRTGSVNISHIWNIFGYTTNLETRNNIGEVSHKNLWYSLRMILSPFEYFVEKSRENVFQKILLSTTFLMPKLLKYSFFCCSQLFFTKILLLLMFWDLVLKKLLHNLDFS